MSISSVADKSGPFAITGFPQTIPVGFYFQQPSDLLVLDYGTDAVTHDPALVLVYGSDYTVTGGGYNAANQMLTGSIDVLEGGANNVQVGDNLIIMRNSPLNQSMSFLATGPLTIALLEQALDKMATLSQQVNEICGRSLHFENFELISGTLSLSARANKVLAFDNNGNISYEDSAGSGAGNTYTAGTGLLLAANQFSVNPTQSLTDLTVTNPIVGSLAGNAATATALFTARTINGVAFNGTANITVTAAAGTLTGTSLAITITAAPGLLSAAVGTFGNMAIQNKTAVDITGGTITGMPTPAAASDVANKQYVDNNSTGIVQQAGCQVATTANITLSGEQTIDGVLTATSRILVKNQTLSQNNGIYVTAAGAWSRASDANTAAGLQVGFYYFVSLGATQGSTGWTIQTEPTILGTDPVVFAQFSASTTYTAGSGLSLTGNVFANTGVRSLTGTANEISLTASTGTPTVSLPTALTLTGKTVTGGTFNATSLNGPLGGGTPDVATFSVGNVSGNTSINADLYLANSGGAADEKYSSVRMNSSTVGFYLHNDAKTLANAAYTIFRTGYQPTIHRFYTGAGVAVMDITSTGINSAAIGTTTPSTGAFTTLTGSSTATGSTTARTLANRFAQVVNVKDFGATGNGVTDDTANLNLALAALTSGATLYFPAGTYNHTGLTFPASKTNVLVKGDQAQLYLTVNGNNTFFVAATNSYITFDGLWFNGVGSSRASGIHLRIDSDYTTVRNCRLQRSSDWAIQVDSAGSAVKGFSCVNNLFIDTLGDGVHMMNADGWVIANNIFWETGDDSIAAISQSSVVCLNGVISGNYIYGRTTALAGATTNGNRGIAVQAGKNILITGNNVYNTRQSAIEVSDDNNTGVYSEEITISNNLAYGCNSAGGALGTIQVYFCARSSVVGNQVISPVAASGFAFADCSQVDFTGNKVDQSLNQFCRGFVNDNAASYNGRTILASNDITIADNQFILTNASNNEALYLVFTTGARCNNLIVAGNKSRSTALAYISCDWIITGKFVNNVTIGGTTTPSTGGNSTGITSANNN